MVPIMAKDRVHRAIYRPSSLSNPLHILGAKSVSSATPSQACSTMLQTMTAERPWPLHSTAIIMRGEMRHSGLALFTTQGRESNGVKLVVIVHLSISHLAVTSANSDEHERIMRRRRGQRYATVYASASASSSRTSR
ncbi:hypothetical protein J6590_018905 [Homalodisca vitripennis]|nr:hypothetical protein J6590_018905 [Homalodisca vitripennis]